MTMFIVLSLWHNHCDSSVSWHDQCTHIPPSPQWLRQCIL